VSKQYTVDIEWKDGYRMQIECFARKELEAIRSVVEGLREEDQVGIKRVRADLVQEKRKCG
jgi:hypothetical protein